MRTTLTALALGASLIVTGCGGTDKPKTDLSACEGAMRTDFASGLANPSGPAATRPVACAGVSDEDLQQIVAKIMGGQ